MHNRDIRGNDFRILFILDYKTTNVNYMGEEVKYIDISMNPGEQKFIDIELKGLENGLHDFMIFCIRKPDDLLNEPRFYPPGQFDIIKRTTLIVGTEITKPEVKYKEIKTIKAVSGETNVPPFVSYNARNTLKGDVVTFIKHNETKPLWLNFSGFNNTRYAILTFLGEEQIEFDPQFIKAEDNGVINLPFNVDFAKKLSIVVVENPYSISENLNGEISNIPWFVNTVNRISIK